LRKDQSIEELGNRDLEDERTVVMAVTAESDKD